MCPIQRDEIFLVYIYGGQYRPCTNLGIGMCVFFYIIAKYESNIYMSKITIIKTVLFSSRRKVRAQFSFWDVIWAKEISL